MFKNILRFFEDTFFYIPLDLLKQFWTKFPESNLDFILAWEKKTKKESLLVWGIVDLHIWDILIIIL